MKLSEDQTIPTLEGWVNLTEAAEILGVSRQHAYRRAAAGKYRTLHRIGTQQAYVVSTAELEDIKRAKAEREQAKEEVEISSV